MGEEEEKVKKYLFSSTKGDLKSAQYINDQSN